MLRVLGVIVSNNGISVMVNGEIIDIPDELSVHDLLVRLSLTKRRLAVELNGSILSRDQFANHILSPGDRIEFVQAIGGG